MARQARERIGTGAVRGRVAIWRYDPATRRRVPFGLRHNQIQDEWMFAAAQSLGPGLMNYRISGMYIEFDNVSDPNDPVAPPIFDKTDGVGYYDTLALSPTRDYLRVPLMQQPLLGVETGYEDIFTAGLTGNKLTFAAMSSGSLGVHGKLFDDSVNSKVFGVALVVIPVVGDRTQDLVFARSYFSSDEQVVKEASHQIGVTWDIAFLRPA